MPVKKAAFKDLRQAKRKTLVNLRVKRAIKDLTKKIDKFILADKLEEAKKLAGQLQKIVDKAAQHGQLKKNTAARRKSRVAGRISRAQIKK
jgi:small subunit ribosomal protein S20